MTLIFLKRIILMEIVLIMVSLFEQKDFVIDNVQRRTLWDYNFLLSNKIDKEEVIKILNLNLKLKEKHNKNSDN